MLKKHVEHTAGYNIVQNTVFKAGRKVQKGIAYTDSHT